MALLSNINTSIAFRLESVAQHNLKHCMLLFIYANIKVFIAAFIAYARPTVVTQLWLDIYAFMAILQAKKIVFCYIVSLINKNIVSFF